MKWIEPTIFAKSCGNPDFRSIFGHQRAKNEGTNTKIDRGPETYPISINPRDEMNWANSFREKLRKPCLQTDRRTDRQTSGWIQYTPFHLRWSGGIITHISGAYLWAFINDDQIKVTLLQVLQRPCDGSCCQRGKDHLGILQHTSCGRLFLTTQVFPQQFDLLS